MIRWLCILKLQLLLFTIFNPVDGSKSATSFYPNSQYVHVSEIISVVGSSLSTADLIAIAWICDSGIENRSSIIIGGEQRRFVNVSEDGSLGQAAFTLGSTCDSCCVCVKFSASNTWRRVGFDSFQSKLPVIISAWLGAIDSSPQPAPIVVKSGELQQLILSGSGLVNGISRLAFKFASPGSFCGSMANSVTEPQELAAVYKGGTIGVLQFYIDFPADGLDLKLCVSSNAGAFTAVEALQFSFLARYAYQIDGNDEILPSIETSFNIVGKNFEFNTAVRVKIDRSCEGVSDASEIEGGDGIEAKFVNISLVVARFQLLPILGSIFSVSVVSAGSGYENGRLIPIGGDGQLFSGSFTVGPSGNIMDTYIASNGDGYTVDPALEPGYNSARCSFDGNRSNCSMSGSVVTVIQGLGVTTGCFAQTVEFVGIGGGGRGFRAAIINDEFGEIIGFDILNHGYGYTRAPQLVVNYTTYKGACKCGSVFFNGKPTTASLVPGDILGNMDPCFTASIAVGGDIAVTDSGWKRRQNLKLCYRIGSYAQWSQVANRSLAIQKAYTSQSFLPVIANSYEPFTLTVIGTGFELTGTAQTKIKLTSLCSEYSDNDTSSSIYGGNGKPCNKLELSLDGIAQVCTLIFTVAVTSPTQLQVCRRIGLGRYAAISADLLAVNPFTIVSFSPKSFLSSAVSAITIRGTNLGAGALSSVRFRGCSKYLCSAGSGDSNSGEPCANSTDNRTCMSGSRCVSQTAFSNTSFTLVDPNEGLCVLPGGEAKHPTSVGECLGLNWSCNILVVQFRFLSMADITGDLSWNFGSNPFQLINSANFSVEGSSIVDFSAVPQLAKSLFSFSFPIVGRNIENSGTEAAKFKYIISESCQAGASSDFNNTVLGGSGRALQNVQATKVPAVISGMVSFQLIIPENFGTVLVDWRIDPKYQTARLCWKIGTFMYRDVGNGVITTIETTRVVGFTPSDGMLNLPSSFAFKNQQIPVFRSNQEIILTIVGRNIGDKNKSSGLRIRPVAMPFDLELAASENCVSSTTTTSTRPETCKEFPVSVDDPFGGAADFCEYGSNINSYLMEDEIPSSIFSSVATVSSADPYLTDSDNVNYSKISFRRTLLRAGTRFMLCWQGMVNDAQTYSSPWQPIGNFISREAAFQTYFVFNTHTFIISGAYVAALQPSFIVAHKPFSLEFTGVGVRCIDTEIKVKLTIGIALQASVGGVVGNGCESSNFSDVEGSVPGSQAVFATCQKSSIYPSEAQNLSASFPMVIVEYETILEICWSMAYGEILYDHMFLQINRTSIASIVALPSQMNSFQINNAFPAEIRLLPHTLLSFSMFGYGFSAVGDSGVQIKISEDCALQNATLPGGEARSAACVFNYSVATAEIILKTSSSDAKLCYETRTSNVVWIDYLDGYRCVPELCGAPSCSSGNYIIDSFECDRTCCQQSCAADPNCKYYTWYEIPSRVYIRCQTSASCNSFALPVDSITIPHVVQKTRFLEKSWVQIGPNFTISAPQIFHVTPQARPPPVSSSTFAVNLQGEGMGSDHMQVNVKLVDRTAFNGQCNNISAKEEHLRQFQEIEDQKAAALKYRSYLKTLNMNGTCAGGNKNCEGGPAPPLTVCSADIDCWGPSGAAGGGKCIPANTGHTCLWSTQCTHGGFCNNSLAYLTLTPLPDIPLIRIPYFDTSEDNTVSGGYGRFVQPSNSTFATVLFLTEEAKSVVFCVAMRDPNQEQMYVEDGFITNAALINSLYSYMELDWFDISPPSITSVFPDHVFINANTRFVFGGHGLSLQDKIKIVYSHSRCMVEGLSSDQADVYGLALGTKASNFEWINALKTNASVSFTVLNSASAQDNNAALMLCYAYFNPNEGRVYIPVGNITIFDKLPVVVDFSPREIFSFEASQISLMGTGLGAAQQLKLVHTNVGCRGFDINDAISDSFGLIPGSMISSLVLNHSRQFETLSDPDFADRLFVMRWFAVFQVNSYFRDSVLLDLCIKYSESIDFPFSTVTVGYHSVGTLTLKLPRVNNLLTDSIESGSLSQIWVSGEGLQTTMPSYIMLIEVFGECNDTEPNVIAGGYKSLAGNSANSSTLSTAFTVPPGVVTSAKVCHCFEMKSAAVNCEWSHVGYIDIHLPRLTDFDVVSRSQVSIDRDSGYSEGPLTSQTLVAGEPFTVIARFSHQITPHLKLVPSALTCQGQNPYTDAVVGGQGQELRSDGTLTFPFGLSVPVGFLLPLQVKFCIYYPGRFGYEDFLPSLTVEITGPFISSIRPLVVVSGQPALIQLTGRGIATASLPSYLSIAFNTSCYAQELMDDIQIVSNDFGKGQNASASFSLVPIVTQQITLTLCWRVGSDSLPVGNIAVVPVATIFEIHPAKWLLGNETAFLLSGVGLNSLLIMKFISDQFNCSELANISSCTDCILVQYADATGLYLLSYPVTLATAGTMRLCFAIRENEAFQYSGLNVTVNVWNPVYLLQSSGSTVEKTDTQRVEALMTNEIPPCPRLWRSDYIFLSQMNGIDLDSPFIYTINSNMKCWSSCDLVPEGYYKPGLCPPGIDMELLSVFRNVPFTLVLAGGIDAGDQVFIASSCGNDLTMPSLNFSADFIPGGEPVTLSVQHQIDVTNLTCNHTNLSFGEMFEGSDSRIFGWLVKFSLSNVSKPGEFNKLCILKNQFASAFQVPGVSIKVKPPKILSAEPSTIWAGRNVSVRLNGIGLSSQDRIRIIDGESALSCYNSGIALSLPGSFYGTLNENTDPFFSDVFVQFDAPSTHARVCYMYHGSSEWEEMTPLLSLRTSGYVYGYESTTHFLYGESTHFQNESNLVGGVNQTISVLPPLAVIVREKYVYSRTFSSQLTVDGYGLTNSARIAILPSTEFCGNHIASRFNLIQGTPSLISPLHTLVGGETRYPTYFLNDGESGWKSLSYCSGSRLIDGCSVGLDSTIRFEYGPFDITGVGLAKVCAITEYTSEFVEIGQINVLRPCITGIYPTSKILLNHPTALNITGMSLHSMDLLKVVDATSCYGNIVSRPYFVQISVLDSPYNLTATAFLTITGPGPGDSSSVAKKVCYSYDSGMSFVDTGLTLEVQSPSISLVFPTFLSLSAERRITFFGNAILQGDQVKIVYSDRQCEHAADTDSVYGGNARPLDVPLAAYLPEDVGAAAWPFPAKSGSAVFLLPRLDTGTFCYLHINGGGWVTVRSEDGDPITVSVVDTESLAYGLPAQGRANWARFEALLVVLPFMIVPIYLACKCLH